MGFQVPSLREKGGKEVSRACASHWTTADVLVVFVWPDHEHPCHVQWSVPRVSHPNGSSVNEKENSKRLGNQSHKVEK